jgi:hypothetical protein
MQTIQNVFADLAAISNLQEWQKALVQTAWWQYNYRLERKADYQAAGDAMGAVAANVADSNWTPVFSFYMLDQYLAAGDRQKAKAVLDNILRNFPDAFYASLASQRGYEAGLLNLEEK